MPENYEHFKTVSQNQKKQHMNYFMRVSPYKKNQKYEKSVFSLYFLDLNYCFTHFALVLNSLWRTGDVADIDYFFSTL